MIVVYLIAALILGLLLGFIGGLAFAGYHDRGYGG